jgi:hypothetical protein
MREQLTSLRPRSSRWCTHRLTSSSNRHSSRLSTCTTTEGDDLFGFSNHHERNRTSIMMIASVSAKSRLVLCSDTGHG